MSKGSNRRPTDEDKFKANYDLIFGKKKPDTFGASTENADEYKEVQRNRNAYFRASLDAIKTKGS